jgi:hypothetical protein
VARSVGSASSPAAVMSRADTISVLRPEPDEGRVDADSAAKVVRDAADGVPASDR